MKKKPSLGICATQVFHKLPDSSPNKTHKGFISLPCGKCYCIAVGEKDKMRSISKAELSQWTAKAMELAGCSIHCKLGQEIDCRIIREIRKKLGTICQVE